MELLVALSAFVLVDVLALRFGFDSRPAPSVRINGRAFRRDL